MHGSVLAFFDRALEGDEIEGKRVLEVGSFDVNGSVRPIIEALSPAAYLGVDQSEGPSVDRICDAGDLSPLGQWDVVVSTEMLEHVEDWRSVVSSLKAAVKLGGLLMLTTRSKGFGFHPYPIDTWRYELADMQAIFADMDIEILQADPEAPGVFLKAWATDAEPVELEGIDLYRMD